MSRPEKIAKGHPFMIVIGGWYGGSIIEVSTVSEVDGPYGSGKNKLIDITLANHRNVPLRSWVWNVNDIKWVKNPKVLGWDLEWHVNKKIRDAIKKYGGAWVVRLRTS